MSRQRRTWSPEEKANIVLEILREESTLAEISQKYDIAQPVLSRWKSDFINNMPSVFDKKGEDIQKVKQEHEEEKETLIKKIGELSMDVDYLKKSTNRFHNCGKKGVNRFFRIKINDKAPMRITWLATIYSLSCSSCSNCHKG